MRKRPLLADVQRAAWPRRRGSVHCRSNRARARARGVRRLRGRPVPAVQGFKPFHSRVFESVRNEAPRPWALQSVWRTAAGPKAPAKIPPLRRHACAGPPELAFIGGPPKRWSQHSALLMRYRECIVPPLPLPAAAPSLDRPTYRRPRVCLPACLLSLLLCAFALSAPPARLRGARRQAAQGSPALGACALAVISVFVCPAPVRNPTFSRPSRDGVHFNGRAAAASSGPREAAKAPPLFLPWHMVCACCMYTFRGLRI